MPDQLSHRPAHQEGGQLGHRPSHAGANLDHRPAHTGRPCHALGEAAETSGEHAARGCSCCCWDRSQPCDS